MPGGELAPAVIVFERRGGLTDADKARIDETVTKLNRTGAQLVLEAQKPIYSQNGAAAIIVQPVQPGEGQADTFENAVQSIRDRIGEPDAGLEVKLTGAAGFSLDSIKVFGGINGTLLYAAAGIVLVLLILIYRSPIFWVIPFFAVVLAEGASRGAGYLLAEAGVIDQRPDRRHPARARLRRRHGLRAAARLALPRGTAQARGQARGDGDRAARRRAGDPGLRPDGDRGAADALDRRGQLDRGPRPGRRDGRRAGDDLDADRAARAAGDLRAHAFWSPGLDTIPHPGQAGTDETHGFWRGVGERVARRPRPIWITGSVVLLVLAANVLNLDTSQTTGNQFRGEVDSVQGQEVLSRNFPAGASAPADVIVGDASKAQAVTAALQEQRARQRRAPGRRGPRRRPAAASRSRATRTRPRRWIRSPRCARRPARGRSRGSSAARRPRSTTCASPRRATTC